MCKVFVSSTNRKSLTSRSGFLIQTYEGMNMQSNLAQQSNNDNSDFLPEDVVVLKALDLLCVKELITLKRFNGEFWDTDHRIGRVAEKVIRSASPAELKAKRRLDPPVALFVSGES
jgi:hypothetical protein